MFRRMLFLQCPKSDTLTNIFSVFRGKSPRKRLAKLPEMPHSAHVPYIHNIHLQAPVSHFQAPSISAFTFHIQQIRSPQDPSNVNAENKMLYSRNVHEKKVKHLFHYAKQKNICFYNIIETTRLKNTFNPHSVRSLQPKMHYSLLHHPPLRPIREAHPPCTLVPPSTA